MGFNRNALLHRAWRLAGACSLLPALLCAPVQGAESMDWPRNWYNPKPRPDDVLLPLPCGGAMAFRWVPATGRVPAGAAPALAHLYRLEGPFARADERDLLIGKYEVTRLQYATAAAFDGGSCPALTEAGQVAQGGIGWYDAQGFAARWSRWLAQQGSAFPDCRRAAALCIPAPDGRTGLVRLPSDDEWEYAARGGQAVTPAQFAEPRYPMPAGLERHAWFGRSTSDWIFKKIGLREPNPLGLHDLYGNVEELTGDLFLSAGLPGQVGAAARRGGSIYTKATDLGSAQRRELLLYHQGQPNRSPEIGLRLVADLAPAAGALKPVAALPAPPAVALAARPTTPWPPPSLPSPRADQSDTMPRRLPWAWIAVLILLAVAPVAAAVLVVRRRRTRQAPSASAAVSINVPTPLASRHNFEPEMIALPGGEYWMGSPDREPGRSEHEGPRHRVRITPFAIGKHAVTFAEYDAFARATDRAKPDDKGWGRRKRPVIDVNWDDAVAYTAWLSQRTGLPYRLPSEAEWEYAARAGTDTPFSTGVCIHTDQANYDGDYDYAGCGAKTGLSREKTVPVGSFPANPWGLHEVHGNVWEWVQDRWHDDFDYAPSNELPWETSGGAERVLRGGSWHNAPSSVRSAVRHHSQSGERGRNVGFRVARTLTS